MVKKFFAALGAVLFIATSLSGCASSPGQDISIEINDGWVRATEKSGADEMSAAFAEITNNGTADVTLVSASTDAAMMTQIHEVVMVDGKMTMREKDGGILIPAGETVILEPGGLHLMLMGLNQALLEGDDIDLSLGFDVGGSEPMMFGNNWQIRAAAAGDEEYDSEH